MNPVRPGAPFPSLSELAARVAGAGKADLATLMGLLAPSEAAEPAPAGLPELPELPESDAAVRAAINETFLLDEIGASPDDTVLLAHSETRIVAGTRRLRLTDAARGRLLGRVAGQERFRAMLAAAVEDDRDHFRSVTDDAVRLPSAWLRAFLAGDHGDVERAPANELRAAAAALESLSMAPDPESRPSLEAVQRALHRAELLEPFRILIAAEGGWDNSPPRDRFRGRDPELRALRSFVDEIQSQGVLESVSRTFKRSVRGVTSAVGLATAELFVLEAQGGLGKSALIAKFVLDHAYGQTERRFPFAYLDFDRATLQPRVPSLLLLETMRQIGLQFPDAEAGMGILREQVRSQLGGQLVQEAHDPYAGFRDLLRRQAGVGSRAFLLVLDTLEVAQYDPAAIAGINAFLENLIGTDGFAELRIVAAGRAGLSDMSFLGKLRGSPQLHKLAPLPVADAIAMADALGRDLLGEAWRPQWAARIAGTPADEDERREPLSVRVAVEALQAADPEEREQLSLDMEKMGEQAHDSFVGRIYQERVLKHVRGEVAKLAWPGLVLRDVTLPVVEEVLAEPCGLPRGRARELFEGLGREIWIVERRGDPSMPVLRHRRELRARTLPLMRRHDPELFDRVNRRAIDHFERSKHDAASRAEWIYHRLLAGEAPESVDRDWNDAVAIHLADAADDFPKASPAHAYLLALTATRSLQPSELLRLPHRLAFEHVARAGISFADFGERRLSPVVLDLSRRPEPEGRMSEDARAACGVIMVKTGRWDRPIGPGATPHWIRQAQFAKLYRDARRRGGDMVPGGDETRAPPAGPDDYRWLAQALAAMKIDGDRLYARTDEQLDKVLDGLQSASATLDIASLRVAALFGDRCFAPAVRLWQTAREAATTGAEVHAASGAELKVLGSAREAFGHLLGGEDQEMLSRWEKAAFRDAPTRIVDADLARAIDRLFGRLVIDLSPEAGRLLRRFLAQRNDDWILPLAYAGARALTDLPDEALAPIKRQVDAYCAPQDGFFGRSNRAADPLRSAFHPRDLVGALRLADEAGDVAGMAATIRSLATTGPGLADLDARIADLEAWTALLRDLEGRGSAETENDRDRPARPGPIVDASDPQRGRWGGSAHHDGRQLRAELRDSGPELFSVDLLVESTDGSILVGPVHFHLHPTFPRSVITIRRITDERRAGLYQVAAYGVFTVGVQVRRADGKWIGLELNLASMPGLPERFLAR